MYSTQPITIDMGSQSARVMVAWCVSCTNPMDLCNMAQSQQVRFAVWNPATGDEDKLPVLNSHTRVPPRAVQLSVDRETKRYKLFVVGIYHNTSGEKTEATMYHSRNKNWSCFEDSSNIVLRCSHSCVRGPLDGPKIPNGSWIYDPANGKYGQDGKLSHHNIGVSLTTGRANKVTLISAAVTNNRAFHLQKVEGMRGYSILEFFYHARAVRFVKSNSCNPLDKLPDAEYTLKLHSCQGFLMVSAFPKSLSRSYKKCHCYCDLSSGELGELPALAEDKIFAADDVMCELQWSIIPKGGRVYSSTRDLRNAPWDVLLNYGRRGQI